MHIYVFIWKHIILLLTYHAHTHLFSSTTTFFFLLANIFNTIVFIFLNSLCGCDSSLHTFHLIVVVSGHYTSNWYYFSQWESFLYEFIWISSSARVQFQNYLEYTLRIECSWVSICIGTNVLVSFWVLPIGLHYFSRIFS